VPHWWDRLRAFREYRDALRRRRQENGPDPHDHEIRELVSRWEAAVSPDHRVNRVEGIPATREELLLEFGVYPLAEPVAEPVDHEDATITGMEYPGQRVEEVVRLASALQRDGRRLARTAQLSIAKEAGATPYMVGEVFELMKRDPPVLADAGRRGWLKLAEQETRTPAFINLHELKKPANPPDLD
jgi:hypothetical protein